MDRDVLERLFAEWERGDFSGAPSLFSDDVRFTATQPEGQVEATGPDGILRFMRGFLQEWERYSVELHELEELGDGRFLATAMQHGIARTSGMQLTALVHIAIAMREGRMRQLEFHMGGREHALAALGD